MEGGSNAIVILLTMGALGVLAVALLHALKTGRRERVKPILSLSGAIIGVYWVSLLAVSLASREQVLGKNEPKPFCGFYLDCHISIAVTDVVHTGTLGDPAHPITANGVFYVVTVRYGSDAIRARLTPDDPRAYLVDARGRRFDRSPAGEQALATQLGQAVPVRKELAPGEFYTTALVFDVAEDAADPRMVATPGFWPERFLELFLIGDEDSLLHRKRVFRLS